MTNRIKSKLVRSILRGKSKLLGRLRRIDQRRVVVEIITLIMAGVVVTTSPLEYLFLNLLVVALARFAMIHL